MCWKTHVPDPQPSPTAMAVALSTVEESQNIANVTQGGVVCPELATACSNATSSMIQCHNGYCCEHNGEPLCSCLAGWTERECDVRIIFYESMFKEAGSRQWLIIGVLIGMVLVGLLIAFIVYRKKRQRNNADNIPGEVKQLTSVHQNWESSTSLPMLKDAQRNERNSVPALLKET